MFVFDDLQHVEDNGLREIIQRVDKKVLAIALKGASEDIRTRFLANMSKRAAEMLKEEIDAMGAIRMREVEKAQHEVVAITRKLEEEGADRHRRRRGGGLCRLGRGWSTRRASYALRWDAASAPPSQRRDRRPARAETAPSRADRSRAAAGRDRARRLCQGLRAGRTRRRRSGGAQAPRLLRRLAETVEELSSLRRR